MGAKLIVLGNRFEKILLQNVFLNNTYKTSVRVPRLVLRGICLYKSLFPFFFLESYKYLFFSYKNRAFYKHTVACEKLQLFIL